MRNSISKYIKELSKEIERSTNILLVCHTNPDGDAIGSMLGLYHYLISCNKLVTMVSPNGIQEFLLWMNGVGEIIIFDNQPGHAIKHIRAADLVIYLDLNEYSRTGPVATIISEAGKREVLIDHHPDPSIEADIMISVPGMSSTAELVFELVMQMNPGFSNNHFIESLFTGMMTDTGNFNFGSFDGDTLRIVADMLDRGLRKDYITNQIYNNFPANRMRLMGYAMSERMVVMPQYHTAYIYLTRSDLDRHSHRMGDTEGFVNIPLSIKGIIFSVLFIEREDHIKLSLRSKGSFDVNLFTSRYFNGGGHVNASGGKSALEMTDCLALFESLLPDYEKVLDETFITGMW